MSWFQLVPPLGCTFANKNERGRRGRGEGEEGEEERRGSGQTK
jgi:hypothetical protein